MDGTLWVQLRGGKCFVSSVQSQHCSGTLEIGDLGALRDSPFDMDVGGLTRGLSHRGSMGSFTGMGTKQKGRTEKEKHAKHAMQYLLHGNMRY